MSEATLLAAAQAPAFAGVHGAGRSVPPHWDPSAYRPHLLHGESRVWLEKNCYVDVWIALLHTLGLEPRAMLGAAASIDFLGDQWTFLKPDHQDLRRLYGVQVQELTLWRPLAQHVQEHLQAGRLISIEADAWWLPDTAATDYRRQHTKTTIVMVHDEPDAERLTYFHNAGLYTLHGEDYRQTLNNGGLTMPLYAEWIDTQRHTRLPEAELRSLAEARLSDHLQWRPARNPMRRFAHRFAEDMAALQASSDREAALARYHAWAFAGTRQLGAAMELLSLHLEWLGTPMAAHAAPHAMAIAQGCKSLILKGARAAATGRPWQGQELLDALSHSWAALMASLGHPRTDD